LASQKKKSSTKKSSKKRGKPQTMEELLAQTGYKLYGFKRGQEIEGKVTAISSRSLFVDIEGKTEGLVTGREYEAVKGFLKNLKIGDKVKGIIVSPENDQGYALLSLKKMASSSSWEKALEAYTKNKEVEVEITGRTPAGFLVQFDSLSGFIPSSQIGSKLLARKESLIGEKVKVKVIEADRKQNRLIFSEKLVSEKDRLEKVLKALKKTEIGKVCEAEVVDIVPFGLFVKTKLDNQEVEGLVHISEISWEKVTDPALIFKKGDKIKVKIIEISEEDLKLAFSIKQLKPDPFLKLIKKYPVESRVTGKVVRLTSYGAFVEIEKGLEGLLHISKIPLEEKINVGDELSFFVEDIDKERKRLSLALVPKGKPVGYK